MADVKNLTLALMELALEKQDAVADAAVRTLRQLGHKQPATVLRTLTLSLVAEAKPSTRFRSTVLTVVESSIQAAIDQGQLDSILAESLIGMALDEMVRNRIHRLVCDSTINVWKSYYSSSAVSETTSP